MNPFPVVFSLLSRNRLTLIFFVVLITFSVGLGIAITMQERAVRQGSARAADKFDLVIGAPGNPFDLVLASVYARPAAMGLVPGDVLVELTAREDIELAAPIAFGDSAMGFPMMGTTAEFVAFLSGDLADGRMFAEHEEAIVGANVPLEIGAHFRAAHDGLDSEETLHEHELSVVGRMQRTHSAWDNVVVVPVEQVWETHGLSGGDVHDAHEHDDHAHDADHAEEGHEDHAHEHSHAAHDHDEHSHDEHEHEDEGSLGGPYHAGETPGVPAIVVKPRTVADAYRLRTELRTSTTQAVFPAEILVQLYALLGDARSIMSFLALATQVLVVAAVLSGVLVILQLFNQRFAVLRALGATRGYVFAVAWTYVAILIVAGAVLGLLLGAAVAYGVSSYLAGQTGVAMPVSLSWAEVQFVVLLVVAGTVLAMIPAALIYRQPVADSLA